MAPTITSQNHTLVSNAEVSFGTITSATGFDFIDAFVDNGGNLDSVAEWRLYEVIGSLTVLVATAPGGGTERPAVLDWGVGATGIPFRGPGPAPYSPAEGGGFTFELRGFFANPTFQGTPPNITTSLIGYDEFDTVASAVNSAGVQQVPANFSEVTLALVGGYAQEIDAVVSQSFNVPVQFTLYALCGGGVQAVVAQATLDAVGQNTRIFGSPVRLPGANTYLLTARFDSRSLQFAPPGAVFVTGGLATHSQSIATGGVVNLTGNDNGPSNANRFLSLLVPATNASVVIPEIGTVPGDGWWYVGVTGLTGTHAVTLPLNPTAGEVVVVTDEDGSLAGQTFNVNGNGNNVEGVGTFAMNATYPGAFGSVCFQFDTNPTGGGAWHIFADYSTVSSDSHGIEATDRNVLAAEFVPASGTWYVGMNGLTADRTVNFPVMPSGSEIIIKDEDGSLAAHNIILAPAGGKTIDGGAYTLNGIQNGVKGSVTLLMNFAAPPEWVLV